MIDYILKYLKKYSKANSIYFIKEYKLHRVKYNF